MATVIGTLKVILGADVTGLKAAERAMLSFEKVTVASVNTMAQRIRTVGYLTTAVLTAPIIGAGKAMFKAASDFEFSMQKIVGLTGVAQSMADDWAESIKELSKSYGRSPQELAEGLYFIASSGVQGAQAMDVLRVSAKAAASGLGKTQEVADLVTSALNAYAGTGLTASQVTNQLVAAVKVGKAEADAFANTIGQVIPLASEMGVSFGELAGGMAAITLTGSSAANAAVYLKGVFNSLQTASTQGEKALNAVGSSYEKLRRILKEEGLIALMQEIRDLTADNEEALRDVLPNLRGLTAYLSIAGKNFKYNKEIINEVIGATQAADEAWVALSETIQNRYNKQVAKLKIVMTELGDYVATAFLPVLEDFIKWIEKVAKWFTSLSESQKKFYLEMVALLAILGPASLLLSSLLYTLTSLAGVLKVIWKVLGTVWTMVKVMSPAMRGFTAAIAAVSYLMFIFKKRGDETDKSYKTLNKTLEETKKVLDSVQELENPEFQLDKLFAQRSEIEEELSKSRQLLYSYRIMAGITKEQATEGKKRWGRWEGIAKDEQARIAQLEGALSGLNEMINTIANSMEQVLPQAAKKSGKSLADMKKELEGLIKVARIDYIPNLLSVWFLGRKEEFKKEKENEMIAKFGAVPQLHLEGYYRNLDFAADYLNDQLDRQRQIASELTNVFQNMFMTIGQGWKAMTEQIIQSIKRLVSELLARMVVFALLKTVLSAVMPGSNLLTGVTLKDFMFGRLGRGFGHAQGNFVVPPGYPNDSYPAMLTSGEAVLTPSQLKSLTNSNNNWGKEVRFKIEGTELVGVLQNTTRRSKLYS